MRVQLNGEEKACPEGATLGDLLKGLSLKRAQVVAEVNRRIVSATEDENLRLAEGDRVELIQFVGGG